jgi:5-methylcytosine-specific restriction endonuclease McrA
MITKQCEHCGKRYEVSKRVAWQSKFCSDDCRYTFHSRRKGYGPLEERLKIRKKQKEENQRKKAKERLQKIQTKECTECGTEFESIRSRTLTCSSECSRIRKNRVKSQRDSKRLNANNIIDKDISLRILYKRDHGICYICNEKCNPHDRVVDSTGGSVGPDYPTIDHIVPLARGGKHAWDNVKLAHHQCNSLKGDALPSEFFHEPIDIDVDEAYVLAKKTSSNKKAVEQYSKEGKLIAVYESTADASKQTKIKVKGIQKCARGECPTYKGYIWVYI